MDSEPIFQEELKRFSDFNWIPSFMLSLSKSIYTALGILYGLLSPAYGTPFDQPPEWSRNAIWYQIFVERFENGDSSNDPRPIDMEGSYPGFVPPGWKITPWKHDWYEQESWARETDEDFHKLVTVWMSPVPPA